MTEGRNFAFKTAAKPFLLRAYKNLLSPYPTVASLIPYDVWFSCVSCVTDRQKRHRTKTST